MWFQTSNTKRSTECGCSLQQFPGVNDWLELCATHLAAPQLLQACEAALAYLGGAAVPHDSEDSAYAVRTQLEAVIKVAKAEKVD